MPARRKAPRPLQSKKDREFDKLLRDASRRQGIPQPSPRITAPASKHLKQT
jgi:hypothetical protein